MNIEMDEYIELDVPRGPVIGQQERDWMWFVAGACVTAFGLLTLIAAIAALVAK